MVKRMQNLITRIVEMRITLQKNNLSNKFNRWNKVELKKKDN